MFVAKLEVHNRGYQAYSTPPESWECPMCVFNILPNLDSVWVRCKVIEHLTEVHRVYHGKIKIRRRKPKKDKVKSRVRR